MFYPILNDLWIGFCVPWGQQRSSGDLTPLFICTDLRPNYVLFISLGNQNRDIITLRRIAGEFSQCGFDPIHQI